VLERLVTEAKPKRLSSRPEKTGPGTTDGTAATAAATGQRASSAAAENREMAACWKKRTGQLGCGKGDESSGTMQAVTDACDNVSIW